MVNNIDIRIEIIDSYINDVRRLCEDLEDFLINANRTESLIETVKAKRQIISALIAEKSIIGG